MEVLFDPTLESDHSYPVRAELLDPSDKVIAGGRYVDCRRKNH